MPLTNIEFWDKNYGRGIKTHPNPYITRMDSEFQRITYPYLKSKSNGEIIEMGCGDSYWLSYFSKRFNLKVSGIDFSKERLDSAKHKLKLQGLDYSDLLCRDFFDIPDNLRNKFDVVYSHGVIEHFKSPNEVLRAFREYLKPKGIIITTVPHLKGFYGNTQKRISQEIYNGALCMDLKEIEDYHRSVGFKIVYSTYYRCLDLAILNFNPFHPIIRRGIYGSIIFGNLFLNAFFSTFHLNLPDEFYSDMMVIAEK
jgi:2-polyprenyl-3-methyl-5-hydroxy-6-metoxy-1,4-benzoquinol methylase